MESVSSRIAKLAPSATMAMNQKGRDLKDKGIDVINMSVGEPDFYTPDHIKEAAKKAIDDNFSFYPPAPGFPDLREAISNKFKRENNLDFSPEQIVVSAGAKNSLAHVIMSLIDEGDEVIVPAPYWVTYVELVKVAEGKNVVIKGTIDNDFKVTAEEIEKVITPKTKAILLCSPSNPTGSVYSKNELESIARVIEKHSNIFVITDEIYEHINFVGKHESMAQYDSIKERVVVINGVSKAYAMTGWRIGYIGAPLWLAKACTKLQGQFMTGPTTIAQKAAVAALNSDQSCVSEMNKAFLRRRDLIIDLLKDIDGIKTSVPDGAFYVFPEASSYYGKSDGKRKIENSTDFCMYLLEEAHIATVPGEAFGEPSGFRISYATSDENIVEAMKRMKNALSRLH
ncbi:MAG: pyridoxal phosphate-dependent aminotransferase [Bacteroidales bacterium]|nr:MAG: pyridoxal phosphate-dependent aminotransferase [Bacteroidales bacterium]